MATLWLRGAIAASVGLAALGCGASTAEDATQTVSPMCQLGDTRECLGPGRCEGAQECRADQAGWRECDCGPEQGSDAGAPADRPVPDIGGAPSTPSEPSERSPTAGNGGGGGVSNSPTPSTGRGGNGGVAAGEGGVPARGGSSQGGVPAMGGGSGQGGVPAMGGSSGQGGVPAMGGNAGQSSECAPTTPASEDTVAQRLERLLTGSSGELLERARGEGWSLLDATDVGDAFDTLWPEPATQTHLTQFLLAHFGLSLTPPGRTSLEQSYLEEGRLFVSTLLLDDEWIAGYFTANSSFFDATVAAAYGAPAPATDWQRSALPAERRGMLTLGAWLTRQRGISQRGAAVYAFTQCGAVPLHPADLDPVVDPVEGVSEREEHEITVFMEPVCTTCHALSDPAGFGFLNFDEEGLYRSEDDGGPINASGALVGSDQSFDGALELQALLAASTDVPACLSRRFLEAAFDGAPPAAAACALSELVASVSPDDTVRLLLRRVATSGALRGSAN